MCEEGRETTSESTILGDWAKVQTTVSATQGRLAELGEKRRKRICE